MRLRILTTLALAAALLAPAQADAAKRPKKVPANFVGVVAAGPLLDNPGVDFASELDRMVTSGVQTTRTVFNWAGAQPYASMDQVPEADRDRDRYRDENGVPTDYSAIDKFVTAAAVRRISVMPVLQIAPMWAARHP